MKLPTFAAAGLAGVAGLGMVLWLGRDDGLASPDGQTLVLGARLYADTCASCHGGAELEGQPNWRDPGQDGILPAPPPHDETGHTWHHGDDLLFAYTKHGGAATLAARGGVSGFASGMPGFGDHLTDARFAPCWVSSNPPGPKISAPCKPNAQMQSAPGHDARLAQENKPLGGARPPRTSKGHHMITPPTRRQMLATFAAFTATAALPARAGTAPFIEVTKDPGCGCCGAWVDILEREGFVTETIEASWRTLAQLKRDSGISDAMASCHTARIDGYVIEGHVPAADIRRLLQERPPDAIGLAVPGMPWGGSPPGMGGPESERDAYTVFLIGKDGR